MKLMDGLVELAGLKSIAECFGAIEQLIQTTTANSLNQSINWMVLDLANQFSIPAAFVGVWFSLIQLQLNFSWIQQSNQIKAGMELRIRQVYLIWLFIAFILELNQNWIRHAEWSFI